MHCGIEVNVQVAVVVEVAVDVEVVPVDVAVEVEEPEMEVTMMEGVQPWMLAVDVAAIVESSGDSIGVECMFEAQHSQSIN